MKTNDILHIYEKGEMIMYLEKIEGITYLTINENELKEQINNVVSNLLGWLVAGVVTATLLATVYYSNTAYQFLTTLF